MSVTFRPDLTVLVGENNSGKSNIVDALRLLTLPLNGRRDRYPEAEDLRRGSVETDFRIRAKYSDLSVTLCGLLATAMPDPTKDEAYCGMRHETSVQGTTRGRTTYWVGQYTDAEPEQGSASLIRHVYLPPLRDAQYTLGSGSAARIVTLLKHFLEGEEEDQFVDYVRRDEKTPHQVITDINKSISAALGDLTAGVRPQAASFGFHDENLTDVARDLRFRLADAEVKPQEIRSSGLGYANLLYMATVIVELAKAREADLTLFLVEEPEAHLHPQLQALVLEFLLHQARKSSENEPTSGEPEGRIQVIVTTHSPNLSAGVAPDHLVVVRSVDDPTATANQGPDEKDAKSTNNEEQAAEDNKSTERYQTVSIAVADLDMKSRGLRKIDRYLDVTRSSLLFGPRAILVEGIAEALLLPEFAQHIVLADDPDGLRRFRGAVLVPIGGVDFKPYVEVLLRKHHEYSIAEQLVVVTDKDPNVAGDRKQALEDLAKSFGSDGNLTVFENVKTLGPVDIQRNAMIVAAILQVAS